MKKRVLAVLLCGLAGFVYAQNLPRLAVMAFTTNISTPKIQADAVSVRELVESRMVASGKYQVISREEIDKLIENQQIQVSNISSRETIKKLELQNIHYIVTGSVNAMGSDYVVTVKILDVSTGWFSHSADEFMSGTSRDMYNGVSTLVSKFISTMGSEEGRVVQHFETLAEDATSPYVGSQPQYSYSTIGGPVLCYTRDTVRYIVVVEVAIGYTLNDSQAQTELTARQVELRDFIRYYFGTKYAEDLTPEKEPQLKQELMELMNTRIFNTAKAKNIVFNQFNVMEM